MAPAAYVAEDCGRWGEQSLQMGKGNGIKNSEGGLGMGAKAGLWAFVLFRVKNSTG